MIRSEVFRNILGFRVKVWEKGKKLGIEEIWILLVNEI